MTVSSVKTGDLGISFALNNNYMEPIATTLVGSGGVLEITFNNIPQTYKHLQLRGIIRQTYTANIERQWYMRFNSDASANYSFHNLIGNGSTSSVYTGTSQTATGGADVICNNGNGATYSSAFSGVVLDILDYTNINKYKTFRSLNGFDVNGAGYIWLSSGLWMNNSEIISITVTDTTGTNFAQYSRLSLYGIKG
jgi:hypothetical protein